MSEVIKFEAPKDVIRVIKKSIQRSINDPTELTSDEFDIITDVDALFGELLSEEEKPKTDKTIKKSTLVKLSCTDYIFTDNQSIMEKTKDKNGCNHVYMGRFYCPKIGWVMKNQCSFDNMRQCTQHD